MEKRKGARSASASELAFAVPFAWEQTPGVPKHTHTRTMSSLPAALTVPPPAVHAPLRKPPCLQDAPLQRPGFSSSSSSASSSLQARHGSSSSQVLVRKQSFSHILPLAVAARPLARKYSLGNLLAHHHSPLIRLEDDPFFMAFQACQKEPIKLFLRDNHAHYTGSAIAPAPAALQPLRRHDCIEDFKPLTVRQLCTLQLQEELHLKKAEREPLIVSHNLQRRHKKGPLSFLCRCLGC